MKKFDKHFFEKNQDILLKVANNWFSRWFLGIKKLPKGIKKNTFIDISPNSLTWSEGEQKKTVLYTKNKFAEALALNLKPVCYIQQYDGTYRLRLSPVAILFFALLTPLFPKFTGLAFIGTTSTFFSTAGAVSPCDGQIINAPGSSNWATVRDATAGTTADASDTQAVPYVRLNGGQYTVGRQFVNVDSSAIPDTDSISSAVYKAYAELVVDSEASAYSYVVAVAATPAGTNTVVTGDFDQVGASAWSNNLNLSAITTSALNGITFNATGIAGISKTGITSFALRVGNDFENVAPVVSGFTEAVFTSADGAANDPYLEVVHAAPVTATGSTGMLMGI